MADRFFLVCSDNDLPLVELVGLDKDDFLKLMMNLGNTDLVSMAWGLILDDHTPDDVRSVLRSEVNFVIIKILLRRLFEHEPVRRFNGGSGVECVEAYLRRVWNLGK